MAFENNKLKTIILLVVMMVFLYLGQAIIMIGQMSMQEDEIQTSWETASPDTSIINTTIRDSDDYDFNDLETQTTDIWGIIGNIFTFFTFGGIEGIPDAVRLFFNIFTLIVGIISLWLILQVVRDFASFIPFIGD